MRQESLLIETQSQGRGPWHWEETQ